MNKQQTAVELVIELYERYLNSEFGVSGAPVYYYEELQNDIKQAKAMEKEQIINAHIDGQSLVSCKDEYAEQYYNETYNNK